MILSSLDIPAFKFTRSVMDAIDKAKYDSMTDFELVDELSRIANVTVPQAIEDIRTVRRCVCARDTLRARFQNVPLRSCAFAVGFRAISA